MAGADVLCSGTTLVRPLRPWSTVGMGAAGARGRARARTLPGPGWLAGGTMDDLLQLALFVAGWIVLQRVILPKLGVPG